MGILNNKKKEKDEISRKPTNDELAIAKKVVFDHVAVKNAVRTLRDFGKEFGIDILDKKGLEQAIPIIRKRDEEDRINRTIEEKIAPLNTKIDKMTEMMSAFLDQRIQDRPPADELPDFDKDAPDYVKERLAQNKKPIQ